MKRYSTEHEWAVMESGIVTVGLSAYAVEQLGDITFVELPETGTLVGKDESVAFVESVKAASDIYVPIGGEIVEINEELENRPEMLNEAAEETWIMKLKVDNTDEFDTLMDSTSYRAFVDTL